MQTHFSEGNFLIDLDRAQRRLVTVRAEGKHRERTFQSVGRQGLPRFDLEFLLLAACPTSIMPICPFKARFTSWPV